MPDVGAEQCADGRQPPRDQVHMQVEVVRRNLTRLLTWLAYIGQSIRTDSRRSHDTQRCATWNLLIGGSYGYEGSFVRQPSFHHL